MEVEKKATKFTIFTGGNIDFFQEYIPQLKESINYIGGIVNCITIAPEIHDKEKIKNHLLCASNNKTDVLIIIDDNADFSTTVDCALKEVFKYDISEELILLTDNLEKNLWNSNHSVLCGINGYTFIISMCGSYTNEIINNNLKENKEKILQIISLIQSEYELLEKGTPSHDKNSAELFKHKHNNLMSLHEGDDNSNVIKSDDTVSSHEVSEEKARKACKEKRHRREMPSIMFLVRDAEHIIRNIINENEEEIYSESVHVFNAFKRIAAQDVYSSVNVPPYRTSAKYGFAVLASDGKGIRRVLIAPPTFTDSEILVVPGTCIQIKSGASIPNGATAVVAFENVKVIDKHVDYNSVYFNLIKKEYEIDVLIAPEENENIRNAGCEIKCDQRILEKYSCIGPMDLNVLRLCSCKYISVTKIPSVGLLSIGDVEDPRKSINTKLYHQCNNRTLSRLLTRKSYKPRDFGIAAYKIQAIAEKIQEALAKVDVLVTMGHANDKDLLKTILTNRFKATIYFGLVDIKPGKSTIFATCTVKDKKKYLLCMSANPTTVPIVAHILLLPLLDELHCNKKLHYFMLTNVTSQHELHSRGKFSWSTLEWRGTVTYPMASCSENQHQMKYGNALIMLPPRTLEKPMIKAREFVYATFFDET